MTDQPLITLVARLLHEYAIDEMIGWSTDWLVMDTFIGRLYKVWLVGCIIQWVSE